MSYLKVKFTKRKACRRKIRPHAPVTLGIFKKSHTGYLLSTERAILLGEDGTNRLVKITKLVDAPFRQNIKKKILTKSSIVELEGLQGRFKIVSRCAQDPLLVREIKVAD